MPLRFLPQIFSTTLTIVIGSLSLFAQQPPVVRLDSSKISPSEIDTVVARLMEGAHVTGAGIAILNNGKVVYLKAYGLRDKEKHLPLTPDSIMTAASLTKPAFATMVMQLVHERIIELDNPHEQHRKYQSETRVDPQSVDEKFCKSFKHRCRRPGSLPH